MFEPIYDLTIEVKDVGVTIKGTNFSSGLKEGRMISFDDLDHMVYPDQTLNEMLRDILKDTDREEFLPNNINLSFVKDVSKKEQILELAQEYLERMKDLFIDEDGQGSDGCNYDLMEDPEIIFGYGVEACKDLFSEFISEMEEV